MRRVKLYVGNIPYTTTEQSLRDAFVEQGYQPVSVKVITDRETNQPRGFAFIELSSQEEADEAIRSMDGRNFGGRSLRVSQAHDRGAGGGAGAARGGPGAVGPSGPAGGAPDGGNRGRGGNRGGWGDDEEGGGNRRGRY